MKKKIMKFFGDLIEKIFKRKELQKFKTQADLLEKEVEEKESIIKGQASQIRILKSGETMQITQLERRMILKAIQFPAFKGWIEDPVTKAIDRIVWRGLRDKIKLHIKQEDNETKGA